MGLALMVEKVEVEEANYRVVNRGGVLQSPVSVCLCAILGPGIFIIIQQTLIYEGIQVLSLGSVFLAVISQFAVVLNYKIKAVKDKTKFEPIHSNCLESSEGLP